jgi:hypothetical protein
VSLVAGVVDDVVVCALPAPAAGRGWDGDRELQPARTTSTGTTTRRALNDRFTVVHPYPWPIGT